MAEEKKETINAKIVAAPIVDWSAQHEKILVEWADKATCYKWLHEKTTREFSKKNRWFTIPVIIMSTVTGTANFAQDKIPTSYLGAYTMTIGTISLIAGIMTTIQQFLKIGELNESHRVSSISWGKFNRNIKVELSKSPAERTPVTPFIKACKEEFDRLIETSQGIPNHIVALFKDTFSGGEIKYDSKGSVLPLTNKQRIFNELTKPEICDSLESVSKMVYKAPSEAIANGGVNESVVDTAILELNHLRDENKGKIESFITSFETEKKRLPTLEEIQDNIDETISLNLIQSVISDVEYQNSNNDIYSTSV
jgi:hypothetical protein